VTRTEQILEPTGLYSRSAEDGEAVEASGGAWFSDIGKNTNQKPKTAKEQPAD